MSSYISTSEVVQFNKSFVTSSKFRKSTRLASFLLRLLFPSNRSTGRGLKLALLPVYFLPLVFFSTTYLFFSFFPIQLLFYLFLSFFCYFLFIFRLLVSSFLWLLAYSCWYLHCVCYVCALTYISLITTEKTKNLNLFSTWKSTAPGHASWSVKAYLSSSICCSLVFSGVVVLLPLK